MKARLLGCWTFAIAGKHKESSKLFLVSGMPARRRSLDSPKKFEIEGNFISKLRTLVLNMSVTANPGRLTELCSIAEVVNMDGSATMARTSLERLKALDSLPDLQSRLNEARQLCTHSARADMVLKWLTEKFGSSEEARVSESAWKLLTFILRLLRPERLATVLGPLDLLETIQSTLKDSRGPDGPFLAIAAYLNLMSELAEGAKGAPLKALLSFDVTKAASFVSVWLNHVDGLDQTSEDDVSAIVKHSLLDPAIRVWALRKRRADEDELFARECLVPAASLVQALSADDISRGSGKRKRGDIGGGARAAYKRALESMLAKHIFLPARTAVLKNYPSHRTSAKEYDAALQSSDLATILAPHKPANGERPQWDNGTIPALLDIGLRCVPAPTSKQRLKERPWVEALFAALLDCASPADPSAHSRTLVSMLSVIGDYGSLSTQTLTKLARAHAWHEDAPETDVCWEVAVEIIKLDATVYVERQMAGTLFSNISEANSNLQGSDGNLQSLADADKTRLRDLWTDSVVIKVMQAFANNRDLPTLIELWHEQLRGDHAKVSRSVWLELDDAFSLLVENHLTEVQLMQCVARHHGSIRAALADGTSSELSASIVVLNEVLHGVRSRELVDHLQAELQSLFEDLISLFEKHATSAAQCPKIWALCERAFELWFPSWAAGQAEREAIAELARTVLSSKAISEGIAFAEQVRRKSALAEGVSKSASDAEFFVVRLGSTLRRYSGSEKGSDVVAQVVTGLPIEKLQPLMKLPGVFGDLESASHNVELMIQLLDDAVKSRAKSNDAACKRDGVQAVFATATTYSQKARIEEILAVTMNYIGRQEDEEGVLLGLRVLDGLPAAALSRIQRERILDVITELADFESRTLDVVQARILLMVRLLEEPCPGASLHTSTSLIWKLSGSTLDHARLAGGPEYRPAIDVDYDDLKTVELLEQLVSVILRHWTATQGKKSSRDVLAELYKQANQHIRIICDGYKFKGNRRLLGILKTSFTQFDTTLRPEFKEMYFDRDCVELYAKSLLNEARENLDPERTIPSTTQREDVLTILDALLHMPGSICEGTNASAFIYTAELEQLVLQIWELRKLGHFPSGVDVSASQAGLTTLVRCLQLICKWNLAVDTEIVTDGAVRLLESGLRPREHAALLAAFYQACIGGYFDSQSKMRLVGSLLPMEKEVSAAKLLLLQVAVSTLGQDDFGTSVPDAPQEVLRRLLRVAVETEDLTTRRRACDCVVTILREKHFMTNQYVVEETLLTLKRLARPTQEGVVYLQACRIFTVLLQQHRSRLRDRLHLVIQTLQTLISCLFRATKSATANGKGLTARHARVLARLLQLLCNPPQLRSRSKTSDLVDEARKAQAHVGQYMQYVLHHYCVQILNGTLGEGVREALMPGLWAMIEAVEINDAEGIKALSAAMNNSERAVLRSLYDDYKTFGKWKGG